ncbi:hypothetical protein Slin15195_G001590 [Septoria linicola]|uniref:Uncharacterized protein n=1 Tax=Septoria linicola TaxID=215465 RepID=A0A9Q9AI50_9PEZI|nr:hypothetical protein Slin14017_G001620 [Septoria linicola]USW46840.1 hypothetical protein Slin15195_G001590 [Septoria linicola]
MRLLPQEITGKHPAFPETPDAFWTASAFTAATVTCGVLAAVPLTLSLIVPTHRARLRSLATKATAYGTLAVFALGAVASHKQHADAEAILETQGINLPHRKYVDRIDHFDLDNAVIFGGLEWHSCFGGTLGATGCVLYKPPRGRQRAAEFNAAREAAQASRTLWQSKIKDAVRSALCSLREEPLPLPAGAVPTPPVDTALAATRPFGTSQGAGGSSPGRPNGRGPTAMPGQQDDQDGIIRDGPHLAEQLPGATEPMFIANTNYNWKSDNPFSDLEADLAKLQQNRHRLALEAELVWSWLSDEEAKYYSTFSKSSDTSPEKQHALLYLETLGSTHTKIWRQANACDWMIADSQKRILQLRSAKENNGTTTYRAASTVQATPEFSLLLSKATQQQRQQIQEKLQQTKAQLAMDLAVGYDEDAAVSQQVWSPKMKKMVTHKEMIAEVREELEQAREENDRFLDVVTQIIADEQKRSKGWWDVRDG